MLVLLAPILVFGLVVFVHELGHFLAAKATGVYAPRFSIGFGPALFRWRRGETEYILAALPLGGYVRMASRHDQETAFLEGGSEEAAARREDDPNYDPEAMIPFGPKPVPEHRWFESKSLLARLFIMIAGVAMNVVLAFVVAAGLMYHYGRVVYPSTVVGAVQSVAGVPALSQLQPGDTIVAVNRDSVESWGDVLEKVAGSRNAVTFTTQRGDIRVPFGDTRHAAQQVAEALQYFVPAVIDTVFPGEPAADAGLRHGDSIVAVNGAPVRSWNDMAKVVSGSPGNPVSFVVARGGALDTLTAVPRVAQLDSTKEESKTVGKIGAGAKDYARQEKIGVGRATVLGMKVTWTLAGSVVGVVRDLFAGTTSVKELGGPVAITRAAVTAARHGVDQLFYLIALLSINVAVLNLLPIPILDGGQILINVLEAAKGSPFSVRTREYILRFGLVAIALLFAVVMYNDTRAGFARLFGWVAHMVGIGT